MPPREPKISSVLFTPSRFELIRKVVLHLHAQSIRDSIELLIACPSADNLDPDFALLQDFAGYKIVEVGTSQQFAARAAAVRCATARIVSLHEDHSYPDVGWGEAILKAFDGGNDAVGPAMYNANPRSALSEAMFLLYHGYAMPTKQGEQATILSDNNAAYLRSVLIGQYGEKLDWWLTRAHELQADMVRRGCRLYRSPEVRVYHLQVSHAWHAAVLRFNGGRVYGARRSEKWPATRRTLYFIGGPLIPFARFLREFPVVRRLVPREHTMLRLLPALVSIEITAALGEMVGYLLGAGAALERRYEYEVNRSIYLNASDKRALARGDLSLPID